MRLKTVSGTMLTLLLIGMLTLAFDIQPVKASGTIYIRANGSIDPPTANITSTDNVTYYFTGNNYGSIYVQRDNIVIDGDGYTLKGTGTPLSSGIDLSGRSNVTIKNLRITRCYDGIHIWSSSNNNTITGNYIVNNSRIGISVNNYSNNNTITENIFTSNSLDGIELYYYADSNRIFNNSFIANHKSGIHVGWYSANNTIYHNNFINNTKQVDIATSNMSVDNFWDNGYPSGGNYWSDYNGTDFYSGPYQNETWSDGIGDTPYEIDENNTDHYPLMYPWGSSPTVGGICVPPNKLELLAPYIGLTVLSAVAVVAVVYVKKRKRHTEIIS